MLIECPECHQQYTITTEQFQSSDGITICPNCSTQFDPIAHLCEAATQQQSNQALQAQYPWEKTRPPVSSLFWKLGVIVGISLFITQFFYFKSDELVQNKTIRPWLEKTCHLFQCQLPMYRNLKEFSVLHSSLNDSEEYYILQVAISNQAEFSQQYPNLKLTLLNFSGTAITKRIFQPNEYLSQNLPVNILSQSETFTIKLDIALSNAKVGGFTIELI
jgi:hypothetical protein